MNLNVAKRIESNVNLPKITNIQNFNSANLVINIEKDKKEINENKRKLKIPKYRKTILKDNV